MCPVNHLFLQNLHRTTACVTLFMTACYRVVRPIGCLVMIGQKELSRCDTTVAAVAAFATSHPERTRRSRRRPAAPHNSSIVSGPRWLSHDRRAHRRGPILVPSRSSLRAACALCHYNNDKAGAAVTRPGMVSPSWHGAQRSVGCQSRGTSPTVRPRPGSLPPSGGRFPGWPVGQTVLMGGPTDKADPACASAF